MSNTKAEKHSLEEIIVMTKVYLSKAYEIRYNEVNNQIEYGALKVEGAEISQNFQNLTDNKLNSLRLELLQNGVKISKDELKALLNSDFVENYNPFKDYFEGVPFDDSQDYIMLLADTVKTKNDALWQKYLAKWLIGVVACAMDGDAINEHVLVIKGKQGMHKTTFIRNLVPTALTAYYTEETINLKSKDAKIQMAECLIINMDEFDNIAGNIDGLKQLTTTKNIRMRRPYASVHENMPRRASFAATINADQFLKDKTGNRRYLVIDAISIERERFQFLDQVFAQAYQLWQQGVAHYFTLEEIEEVNEYNKQFEVVHAELEAIEQYLIPASEGDENAKAMTATDITQYLAKRTGLPMSGLMVQKVGAVLQALGFVKRKTNGKQVYDVSMVGWE